MRECVRFVWIVKSVKIAYSFKESLSPLRHGVVESFHKEKSRDQVIDQFNVMEGG